MEPPCLTFLTNLRLSGWVADYCLSDVAVSTGTQEDMAVAETTTQEGEEDHREAADCHVLRGGLLRVDGPAHSEKACEVGAS